MRIVHNGAELWDTLAQRDPSALASYLADAVKYQDSSTARAAIALENWPEFLAPVNDELVDPWRLWERLRAYAEAALPTQPSSRRCVLLSHRQFDSRKAVHSAITILAHSHRGSYRFDVWLDVRNPALHRLQSQPIANPNAAI